MFVCGPNLKFYYASVKWPGAVNDARVLRNSSLQRRFENGWRPFENAILLGDIAYPLRDWIVPPIDKAVLSDAEKNFNRAHKSTRRLIECAYGVFKESFQCLKRLRVKTPTFACEIIKACAMVHNFRTPDVDAREEDDDGGAILNQYGLESEADTEPEEDAGGASVAAQRAAGQRRLRFLLNRF